MTFAPTIGQCPQCGNVNREPSSNSELSAGLAGQFPEGQTHDEVTDLIQHLTYQRNRLRCSSQTGTHFLRTTTVSTVRVHAFVIRNGVDPMAKEKFTKIPIAEVTGNPNKSGFYDLIRESYWAVTEDDCILLYRGYSRQCNTNKSITERVVAGENHPGVKVVYLAEVWLPHNCKDYV